MNEKNIKIFPKTDIYLAIFFNIITAGIYSIYWLDKKTEFLNSHSKKEKIPMVLIYICYVLIIIHILYIPYAIYWLYFIFKIILLFMVRNKMHEYFDIHSTDKNWFRGLWTFILGFLYFIYKINNLAIKNNSK
jgi:preprotein translocase subunit Sec61beta